MRTICRLEGENRRRDEELLQMSTYWDDAAALVLVAWAGSYLVYRGIQTMRRRTSSGGCGSGCVHCPVKQAAAEVPPVTSSGTLVMLSVPHHLRHL